MFGKHKILALCLVAIIIFLLFVMPRIHPIRLAAKMNLRPVILCSIYILRSFGTVFTSLGLDHFAAVTADLIYDVGNNAVQKGWYSETNLAARAIRSIGVKSAQKTMNEAVREAVVRLSQLSLSANEFASGQVTSNILFNLISLTAHLSVDCPHLVNFAVQKIKHLQTVVDRATFDEAIRQASVWASDFRPELVSILQHLEENPSLRPH